MNENVLIKSEKYVLKSIIAIFFIIGIVIGTFLLFTMNDILFLFYDNDYETYFLHFLLHSLNHILLSQTSHIDFSYAP